MDSYLDYLEDLDRTPSTLKCFVEDLKLFLKWIKHKAIVKKSKHLLIKFSIVFKYCIFVFIILGHLKSCLLTLNELLCSVRKDEKAHLSKKTLQGLVDEGILHILNNTLLFLYLTQFTVGKLPENGLQEIIDLNRETFVQLRENILGVKEHRRLGKIFLLVYILFSAMYVFFNIISV